MAWTTEEVNPTLIENTTMTKRLLDGVPKTYWITPNEGYVLHDSRLDEWENFDDNGNPIGEPSVVGYYSGTRTISASYDFATNPWQLYAVLSTDIPENGQIFNIVQPPEIMSTESDTETE